MTPDLIFPNVQIHTIFFEKNEDFIEQISMIRNDDVFYCLPETKKMCNVEKIIRSRTNRGVGAYHSSRGF